MNAASGAVWAPGGGSCVRRGRERGAGMGVRPDVRVLAVVEPQGIPGMPRHTLSDRQVTSIIYVYTSVFCIEKKKKSLG
jgi:hypothetical protein